MGERAQHHQRCGAVYSRGNQPPALPASRLWLVLASSIQSTHRALPSTHPHVPAEVLHGRAATLQDAVVNDRACLPDVGQVALQARHDLWREGATQGRAC